MSEFVLPEGIKIGHADDGYTGVTVILSDYAVGGVCVRGGAPGTRETDMLRAEKSQGFVNAVVLSGGSAYGLEASCGVMKYLREQNIGFRAGEFVVPLVAQAILFDLNTPGQYRYPTAEMGYTAAVNATANKIKFGRVGAGKGATVGKILGPQCASAGGIGGATVRLNDVFVTAVVAVNALGDVYDKSGKIIAGARTPEGFFNTAGALTDGRMAAMLKLQSGTNTTIGCIMTNAALDKTGANKLAAIAHNGLALAIRPVHTDADGDTLFALSKGDKQLDFSILGALAVEATAAAVCNAVSA